MQNSNTCCKLTRSEPHERLSVGWEGSAMGHRCVRPRPAIGMCCEEYKSNWRSKELEACCRDGDTRRTSTRICRWHEQHKTRWVCLQSMQTKAWRGEWHDWLEKPNDPPWVCGTNQPIVATYQDTSLTRNKYPTDSACTCNDVRIHNRHPKWLLGRARSVVQVSLFDKCHGILDRKSGVALLEQEGMGAKFLFYFGIMSRRLRGHMKFCIPVRRIKSFYKWTPWGSKLPSFG